MDVYSRNKRSELMRSVRTSNTAPERAVKTALRRLGISFTSKTGSLPGRPDVVLPESRTAVLVHGCFWHHHLACKKSKLPATNGRFWREKIEANVVRDKRGAAALRRAGWKVRTVWECETRRASFVNCLARRLGVQLEA